MKTLDPKEGFNNRHTEPLPNKPCNIKILAVLDSPLEREYVGRYRPARESEVHAIGYIGTVMLVNDNGRLVYQHAWEDNDLDFIYYQIL